MVLGGEGFGKWIGHEGRALMNKIRALIKGISESSLALSEKMDIYEPGSRSSPHARPVDTLILDFPDSKIVRNMFAV